jgi:hypothetical protein
VEPCSTVPKNNHEKQHFAASPILRLGSKNQWALPSKIRFVSFTKHKNVWLPVNLTRSHNNKQHLGTQEQRVPRETVHEMDPVGNDTR